MADLRWHKPERHDKWHAYSTENGKSLCATWAWVGFGIPHGARKKQPAGKCCAKCEKKAVRRG